jgi:hypothetical protein
LGEQERWSSGVKSKSCAGVQEIWSKMEYNRMIRNRVERMGNIKDEAECRSGGSCDWSHVVGVPEIESVVRWRRAGESRVRLGIT